MKKIVRLKESDLHRIVKRVIRESQNPILNELGGMDDGHPFSGDLNFGKLSPEERERVDNYYRVNDVSNDDSFSEIDSELGDDFEDDEDGFPEWEKLKRQIDDRNGKINKNSERPFRPRPFNRR
jgi:hypothetical protein